jgi:hypothetical protein
MTLLFYLTRFCHVTRHHRHSAERDDQDPSLTREGENHIFAPTAAFLYR